MNSLLRDRELAEWLGISEKTIRNRLCAGIDMPAHIRIGRTRRWDPEDVNEWLDAKRVRSPDSGPRGF